MMNFSYPLKISLLFGILLSGCGGQSAIQEIQEDDYTPDKVAEINLKLGLEYLRLGKTSEALSRLKKSLAADNNYADTHGIIAALYDTHLKQYELARKHYETAVLLRPMNSDFQNNYGQFLCKQGEWTKAEEHFLKAVENPIYGTPEYPYTNAGICALQNKDFDKAELYLRRALQANPKFIVALYQMAKLSYDTRHYSVARDYLQRYSETVQNTPQLVKHTPETLWLGIQIARALGDKDTEASHAMLLRSQYPDSEQTFLLKKSENPNASLTRDNKK